MGEQRRILLVDDDRQVLFVLEATLRRMPVPCDVITANDGHDAYHLLQTDAFDLLVTDIRLPAIDGVTLTEFARSSAQPIAVIWITAHGCAPLCEDATRLGVYRCLEKPVEIGAFRTIVHQALTDEAPDGGQPSP